MLPAWQTRSLLSNRIFPVIQSNSSVTFHPKRLSLTLGIGSNMGSPPWQKLQFSPPGNTGTIYLPRGMIQLDLPGVGALVDPRILSGTFCQGVSLRQAWHDLEPTQGNFNPAYFDGQIAAAVAANKSIMLRVTVNESAAPAWVMSQAQNFIDSNNGKALWVYWDPFGQSSLIAMYQYLGARYGNIPNVKWIAVAGATGSSGDWSVPTKVNNWNLGGNFTWPAFGQTTSVTPAASGNPPIYPGSLVQISQFGWAQVQSIVGTPQAPSAVVLLNLGLPGNATHGTVFSGRQMQVDDSQNWLSPLFGYTSARLIAAIQARIDACANAFPNSIITLACGRNGPELDTTTDYCAQQVAGNSFSKWGTRFEIQKNQLNATTLLPPGIAPDTGTDTSGDYDSTNFYIFNLMRLGPRRGIQWTWWSTGDPSYRNNGGVPADPMVVLQRGFLIAAQWGSYRSETYEVDALALQAAQNQLRYIPITPYLSTR